MALERGREGRRRRGCREGRGYRSGHRRGWCASRGKELVGWRMVEGDTMGSYRRVRIHGDAELGPLFNVGLGNVCVVGRVIGVTGQVGNFGHGIDANDAFESQIGLIAVTQ